MARQYRMNIGTIVESPMMKVKLRNRTLGSIEENFVVNLSPGDTFLFGGQVLTFEGISNAAVMVSRAKGGEAQIPSYGGGRLPLSTNLSLAVRQLIGDRGTWSGLPDQIRDWLALHGERSALPDAKTLLVEIFPHRKRYHTVVYSFAGRNANQTLGFLLLVPDEAGRASSARFLDDRLCACRLVAEAAAGGGKPSRPGHHDRGIRGMASGHAASQAAVPRHRDHFRPCRAAPSGPGQDRPPDPFSSDLIYDVLRRHEPDHILLKAVRRDAMQGLIDAGRLADTLQDIAGRIVCRRLDMISPMAVPVIMQIARENTVTVTMAIPCCRTWKRTSSAPPMSNRSTEFAGQSFELHPSARCSGVRPRCSCLATCIWKRRQAITGRGSSCRPMTRRRHWQGSPP